MAGPLLTIALASCEFLGPVVPTPPGSAPWRHGLRGVRDRDQVEL